MVFCDIIVLYQIPMEKWWFSMVFPMKNGDFPWFLGAVGRCQAASSWRTCQLPWAPDTRRRPQELVRLLVADRHLEPGKPRGAMQQSTYFIYIDILYLWRTEPATHWKSLKYLFFHCLSFWLSLHHHFFYHLFYHLHFFHFFIILVIIAFIIFFIIYFIIFIFFYNCFLSFFYHFFNHVFIIFLSFFYHFFNHVLSFLLPVVELMKNDKNDEKW